MIFSYKNKKMMNTIHKKPRNPTQTALYCQVLPHFTESYLSEFRFLKPHNKKLLMLARFLLP